ncbi:MAG: class I SAM-dependent methyltransferase [Candidatus Methylumidiphilus sp.]
MDIDQERFGAGALPIWVHHEHQARWIYASKYVADAIIADCACGMGLGTHIFANSGGRHVYAFDLSADAVNATKLRCSTQKNVTVAQSNGLSLPLESASIDVFVSFETIEHIDDDSGFLSEVVRVLSPNGTFICSTPNRTITMPGKQIMDKPWNPFHVREYNAMEFMSLLSTKFADVSLLGQNPTPYWRMKLLEKIGSFMPGHVGGRLNSALKIPRFLYDKLEHHSVVEIPSGMVCEYIVAVCKAPKV